MPIWDLSPILDPESSDFTDLNFVVKENCRSIGTPPDCPLIPEPTETDSQPKKDATEPRSTYRFVPLLHSYL